MDIMKSEVIDEYQESLSMSIDLKKSNFVMKTLERKNDTLQAGIKELEKKVEEFENGHQDNKIDDNKDS